MTKTTARARINPTHDELLAQLAGLYSHRLDVSAEIRRTVAAARRRGASWETIGLELNMSKQAAWAQYARDTAR
jgi:hypothetical protein